MKSIKKKNKTKQRIEKYTICPDVHFKNTISVTFSPYAAVTQPAKIYKKQNAKIYSNFESNFCTIKPNKAKKKNFQSFAKG